MMLGSSKIHSHISVIHSWILGWDSVVGVTTCYELDGPGIESL
jgi:hypothetical protein